VLHGLLELDPGGAQVAQKVQGIAQVVVGEGVFGAKGQGLAQHLRCSRVLAQLDAHHAQLHEAGRVIGGVGQRLFVPSGGLGQAAGGLGGLRLLEGCGRRWCVGRRGGVVHGLGSGIRTVAAAHGEPRRTRSHPRAQPRHS
jgi:hypothetical protein